MTRITFKRTAPALCAAVMLAGMLAIPANGDSAYSIENDTVIDNYRRSGESVSASDFTTTLYAVDYDGSYKYPGETVKDGKKSLVKDKDYNVEYKSNIMPGIGKVIITGTGDYRGSKTLNFKIKPKKGSVKKAVSPGSRKIKVTWKKDPYITGYQLMTATDKSFGKNKKTYTISKKATTSKTVSGLKKGTKYYVKVRSYKKVGETKIYGQFSAVKGVKVK